MSEKKATPRGSIPARAAAMVKAAEMEMEVLNRHGFSRVIFSLKSSDVNTTVAVMGCPVNGPGEAGRVFREELERI